MISPFLMAQGELISQQLGNILQEQQQGRSSLQPKASLFFGPSNSGPIIINPGGGGSTTPVDPPAFVFNQPTPAASWLITHSLNSFPSVTLTDPAGNIIMAQVQYLDANTAHVTFSQPVAGSAYLSV